MTPATADDSIVQEITIRASAQRVFEALTDPEQLVKWWRVESRFEARQVEMDLRTAGRWMMRGIGMNGNPFTIRGEYRVVDRPHRLEFTWLPDWQQPAAESIVRIDLVEREGVTTVRLTHSGLLTDASRANHQGWPQLLDRLRHHVELEPGGRG